MPYFVILIVLYIKGLLTKIYWKWFIIALGALDKAYDKKIDVPYLYQVFNVVAIIGEGSFGVVYKAIKKEDGRTFAIKVSKQRGIKGMTNEVKTLEKIGTHPNIVKYHFAWKEMGNVFIQFEYCVSSLAKYSRYNHKIRELELWDIFLDMILVRIIFIYLLHLIYLTWNWPNKNKGDIYKSKVLPWKFTVMLLKNKIVYKRVELFFFYYISLEGTFLMIILGFLLVIYVYVTCS